MNLLKTPPSVYYTVAGIFPEPEFPLALRDSIHPASFQEHSHEFVELLCVAEGQGVHRLARAASPEPLSCGIMHGDLFILKPGDAHSFVCCKGLRLFNVLFMPSLIEPHAEELAALPGLAGFFGAKGSGSCKLRLPLKARAGFERNVKELAKELRERLPGYRLAAKAKLLELLTAAGRLELESSSEAPAGLARRQAVNKALRFMELNLACEISLESIAEEARLSVSYLSHVFKELTGLSPWSYLLRLRVERAKELLSSGQASIEQAALRSGFCDGSHMASVFKRLEGVAPRELKGLARR